MLDKEPSDCAQATLRIKEFSQFVKRRLFTPEKFSYTFVKWIRYRTGTTKIIFHKCLGKRPSFKISLRGVQCTVQYLCVSSILLGPAQLYWHDCCCPGAAVAALTAAVVLKLQWLLLQQLYAWSCSSCCYSRCCPRAAITGLPETHNISYERWSADITGLAHYLNGQSLTFFWKESNKFILSYTK